MFSLVRCAFLFSKDAIFWYNNVPYVFIEKEKENCVIRKQYENDNIERKEVEVVKTKAPIPLKKQSCPPACASLSLFLYR
jgi:hypothetical protein